MRLAAGLVTAGVAVLLSGCQVNVGDSGLGKEETRTVTLEKPKADMVEVTAVMGAGELVMSGGAAKLMEGKFTFNQANMEPEVQFDDSSFKGRLNIRHKGNQVTAGDNMVNRWDVKLADDVRLDLDVTLGAGESELKLGTLNVRSLKVKLGAGQVEVDLRGPKKTSCDVEISGGVGEATVWVPNSVGVIAEAKGGLGEIDVRGLRQDGGKWTNELYGKSPVTIRLDVRGGIGAINIRAE